MKYFAALGPRPHKPKIAGSVCRLLIASLLWLAFAWVRIWPLGRNYTFIGWDLWQWLPREALQREPLTSLWLLHAQPPLMNAFLALCVQLEQAGIMRTETGASLLMGAVSWLGCVAWMEAAWRALRSVWLSAIVIALILLNPSFDFYAHIFHYPNVELAELGVAILLAERLARRPRATRLTALMVWWALIIYTRSLWHPVTGLGIAAMAMLYLRGRGIPWRRALKTGAGAALLFAALIAPWSIKNRLLFNTSGFSSWLGLNIRNLGLGPNALWGFAVGEAYDPKNVRKFYSHSQWKRLQGHPAVELERKPPEIGSPPNMNHFAVPVLGAQSVRQTLEGYRRFPGALLINIWERLVSTDLPAYYLAYSYDRTTGSYKLASGAAYGAWFDRIYYGGWLRGAWAVTFFDRIWRPSFYILSIYPIAWIGALRRLKRWRTPRGFTSAVLLFMAVWVWAMILLVDGAEGARMRWQLEPAILILFFWALRDARRVLPFSRRKLS